MRRTAAFLVLFLLTFLPAAAHARQSAISVFFNGEPVVFKGQGAVSQNGAVLVPLREIFTRLGAVVKFDAPTQTITATRGLTVVTLKIGASEGVVDVTTRPLSVPAQNIGGTTLVPLRFIAEAFGATVRWNSQAQIVQIAAASLPPPGPPGPVNGTLSLVDASKITVQQGGPYPGPAVVEMNADAIILAKPEGKPQMVVALSDLRVGDAVTIRRDAQAKGTILEATYSERVGVFRSLASPDAVASQNSNNANVRFTFADDSTLEVLATAPVLSGGMPVLFADIRPRDTLTVRVNPQTLVGVGVTVEPFKIEVASLTHNGEGRTLRAGDEVTVTVVGTAGATGTFSIEGVPTATNLPLKEAEAGGTYTGTAKIPETLTLPKAAVTATLAVENRVSPPLASVVPLAIDSAGPVFAELAPGEGATTAELRPHIFGSFADAGSGVDAKAVQITVNDVDVTASTDIAKGFFSYRPPANLPPGRALVVVTARDGAGNTTKQEWAFTVSPVINPLKVVTITPENQTLGTGDVLQVRAEAAPGGFARFAIGKAIVNQPLREETTGVYTGTYTVRKGDSVGKATVVVTFATEPGGKEWTLASLRTVALAGGAPAPPIIDTPAEASRVGSNVTISGRAAPNATVRLTLKYDGKDIFFRTSDKIAAKEVKTDANGNWTTEVIPLNAPRGTSALVFTLEAVAINGAGEMSAPATVRFRK